MVKNTTGGTGTKSLARKHQTGGDNRLRLPECVLEQFACVTKMFGNGMCEIYTNNNVKLIGHIRSKFRGKQKRHNLINPGSIVLVGLREWENPIKNCDIMTIYDENQIDQLSQIPSVKIEHIMQLRLTTSFEPSKKDSNVIFTQEEDEDEVAPQKRPAHDMFTLETTEEVDIDDI